jgi:hypothetical protein
MVNDNLGMKSFTSDDLGMRSYTPGCVSKPHCHIDICEFNSHFFNFLHLRICHIIKTRGPVFAKIQNLCTSPKPKAPS